MVNVLKYFYKAEAVYLGNNVVASFLEFYESEIDFLVALMAGLEYKIKKAPVAISGNWQPTLHFGDLRETLQPVRFGLGLKLAF